MPRLTVTAAIIIESGEILCMQRGIGKYEYISNRFEFPGGKVEKDESFEQALRRELNEELDLSVEIDSYQSFLTVEHDYSDFSITMHSYIVPVTSREFTLKEHKSFVWLPLDQLSTLDWAPADLPIVKKLEVMYGA